MDPRPSRGAILTLVLPVALWLHPGGDYPAILGLGHDGGPFHGIIEVDTGEGAAARERLVWTARRAGAIELAPRLLPGQYRIAVTAGGQGTPEGPTIRLELDGRVTSVVPMAAAAPPVWLERDYAAIIAWPGGRLPIRVQVTHVSAIPPTRLAYVDKIEVTEIRRDTIRAARAASSAGR